MWSRLPKWIADSSYYDQFYRPSAVNLARVVVDLPVIAVQVCIFGVIMYCK